MNGIRDIVKKHYVAGSPLHTCTLRIIAALGSLCHLISRPRPRQLCPRMRPFVRSCRRL